ncbi:hypothetical protein KCP74_11835 [Salmonella enterica subsp. enterica]|nr:hypothetical protein KCP74_11835 [Salmonella enterica subsp. enterica]
MWPAASSDFRKAPWYLRVSGDTPPPPAGARAGNRTFRSRLYRGTALAGKILMGMIHDVDPDTLALNEAILLKTCA